MSTSPRPAAVVRKILGSTCIAYTVIVIFLCIVLNLISEDTARSVSPTNFLLVFPFSLCFSAANYIDKRTSISSILKFLIHCVLTVGGFFCFLYLPAFSGNSESNSFVVLIAFAVCYLIVYGVILLFRKRWNKEVHAESDYTPQFAQNDDTSKKRTSKK